MNTQTATLRAIPQPSIEHLQQHHYYIRKEDRAVFRFSVYTGLTYILKTDGYWKVIPLSIKQLETDAFSSFRV